MPSNKTKEISKLCSFLLRHQPEKAQLDMDENGWVAVDQLLENCAKFFFAFSSDELTEAVATNDKKRFAFSADKSKIRANQGHSIQVDVALKPTPPPALLYHGTAQKNLESIMQRGLQKQNRLHVHLSDNKESARAVGTRHGKPVVLTIDAGQMFADGHQFFLSENGVWLVDAVDTKYLVHTKNRE
ncbi:RNA 2'-phosphotransferase [bacterium]|nr:RNA 2'-phosphotransferase [bacterium]